MDGATGEFRIPMNEEPAGRRSVLRTLGLASIGALASLRLTGEAEAKKQSREQRRRARQQRRA